MGKTSSSRRCTLLLGLLLVHWENRSSSGRKVTRRKFSGLVSAYGRLHGVIITPVDERTEQMPASRP
ncbi:hypothetical protein ACFC08_23420 [Streptomyces sp. NPDC056112]|uniref:hypothetical protein n=1 Tax=unclassified Streptomyces TaxID=2593676 RepID=UPI001CD2C99B|nr:hypothetical protein [Streptomyces sp. CoT10]